MIREQERIRATKEDSVPGAWCEMTACTTVRSTNIKTSGWVQDGFRTTADMPVVWK